MLEKMGEFFDDRLREYESHQLDEIDCAREFYPFTANCLPLRPVAKVLDLGCGTGLELDYYFSLNPSAEITGIDVAPTMLQTLKEKFSRRAVKLILGSYFEVPFENNFYDAAVSVESLHHFTQEEKIPLYRKVLQSLAPKGYFVLTDYFASTAKQESFFRSEFIRLKGEQGIRDGELYHYDTPLTVEHETEALREAGFSEVCVLRRWGATCTIKAEK